MNLKSSRKTQFLGVVGLFVAGAVGFAGAQATALSATSAQTADLGAPASINPGQTATGKPLENTTHEGFWGHINPFARKKWVNRQVEPIRDRTNELDEVQARNANDIRDVDARATAGINRAMSSAQAADSHAADAASRADQANSLAIAADTRTTALNGTVSNLDQYTKVSDISMLFYKGRTALTVKQKSSLDHLATTLAGEKGYIVEVEGYSRNGVAVSQAMADSVVRYLVTAHQIPVYRIYRTGLGNPKQIASADNTGKPLANGVRVTVMHNSLATMSENVDPATSTYSPADSLPSTLDSSAPVPSRPAQF